MSRSALGRWWRRLAAVISLGVGGAVIGDHAGAQADDWRSRRAELQKAVTADQTHATRAQAIQAIAANPGVEPTRVLLAALDESIAEQELLQARFDALSVELQDVLVGKQDIRLAAPKKKEQLEERKQIGERMLAEAELDEQIVAVLALRKDDESAKLLASLVAKPADWKTRTRLVEIVGRLGRREASKEVHGALRDKDARVRVAAIDACVALGQAESAPFVASMLADKEWPVRAAAVAALGKLPDRTCVPKLIEALGKESGRLREEIASVLSARTGQAFGQEPRAWSSWWEQHGAAFAAGPEPAVTEMAVQSGAAAGASGGAPSAKSAGEFSYYGIKTSSDKVVFVLDISDSMNDDAGETELPADGVPKRVGNLRPKIQVARDQLAQTIVELPAGAPFAIITYNKYVKAWQEKLVPANKRWKNEALSFVMGIVASDATNIFDALELALSMGGPGLADKYYSSQIDTIFFLTDGKATDGRIQEPEKILEELRRINKHGKVKIHAIGFGYLHDRPFLEQLAKEHGGTYVNVQ